MHLVTSEEMRRLDRYTIDTIGIPALVLMENAGRAIAEAALRLAAERFGGRGGRSRWLVLAGRGNNGGDGLVAARHLLEAGAQAAVVYAEPPERLTGDAALQRDAAARFGVPIAVYAPGAIDWREYDGVIDALLGTGTRGEPRAPYGALIGEANGSGLPIVAADIPSGLDADTGELHEPCIRAAVTVALAFAKRGLMQYPGAEAAGDVRVAPIGIPARLADEQGIAAYWVDEAGLRSRFGIDPQLPRRPDTHKGTYGHALIAAGCRRMLGAGLLSLRAALRAGCGLATWALPEHAAPDAAGRVPEAMLAPLADGGRGDWAAVPAEALTAAAAGRDALVLGPGLGRFAGDALWLRRIWDTAALPLVLDADALNMLADADDFAAWPRRTANAPAVLTPHPGEMARLARLSVPEVQRDRMAVAREYAVRHGLTLVLKGSRTVTATPGGALYVNSTGNPGMATGGSGDTLAGIIGSLLAQGWDAERAAAFGVWWHGAAGDRAAAARPTPASLLAGDIIDWL